MFAVSQARCQKFSEFKKMLFEHNNTYEAIKYFENVIIKPLEVIKSTPI